MQGNPALETQDMSQFKEAQKWLVGPTLVALALRVLLIVGAALASGADPLVALLGGLGAEAGPRP